MLSTGRNSPPVRPYSWVFDFSVEIIPSVEGFSVTVVTRLAPKVSIEQIDEGTE